MLGLVPAPLQPCYIQPPSKATKAATTTHATIAALLVHTHTQQQQQLFSFILLLSLSVLFSFSLSAVTSDRPRRRHLQLHLSVSTSHFIDPRGMEITYAVTVDNTECAYFDQVEKLSNFGSRNRENIAQLVWAFFNYWAYCHDYANDVISVRRGSGLSLSLLYLCPIFIFAASGAKTGLGGLVTTVI